MSERERERERREIERREKRGREERGRERERERERGEEMLRETHAGYWFLHSMTNIVAVKPGEPLFHTYSQPQQTRDAPLRNTHQ